MREKHEHEQYFFDEPTLRHLASFAERFPNPCCLCTPTLGRELEKRGVSVRTLDVDERFALLRGFRLYDINNPEPLGEEFGLIICDPPILNSSLGQVLRAVEVLSSNNYAQPLLLNYLSRHATTVMRTFAPFGLRPTGYKARYTSIENVGRNQMEFFGNLGQEQPLKPPTPAISRP